MSDQGVSTSFLDLTYKRHCLCWYKGAVYIKNGTKQDWIIFFFFWREEDDTAWFLLDEVKRLGLREADCSIEPFQWKRRGQLKIDISIGNLHHTKKISCEKVGEMNFLENVCVRLPKNTVADTTTLTINFKDNEATKKKVIFSADVKITLKKQQEKGETGQPTQHSIEVPAQPVGQGFG